MNFQIKLYNEGNTSFYAPNLKNYRIPQDAPVFYNPKMEFNRDFSIIIVQNYQKQINEKISICDPLSGIGIRGIRYGNEVDGVKSIIINDINKDAYNLIKKNIDFLNLGSIIEVFNTDANYLLEKISISPYRLDVLDIDPFGSPVTFLDSGIRSLKKKGLMMLTATDMQVLSGINIKACVRKYGGYPLRNTYSHEIAVRLLLGCLTRIAGRFNYSIKPLVSFSKIHYIRTFCELNHSITQANNSINNLGYILHCFSCDERIIIHGLNSQISKNCPNCNNSNVRIAGPLWLGNIQNKQFLSYILKNMPSKKFKNMNEIQELLIKLNEEAEMPPTFYNIHEICKKLKTSPPKFDMIIDILRKNNYLVSRTHFCSLCIKTDANITKISELIQKIINEND